MLVQLLYVPKESGGALVLPKTSAFRVAIGLGKHKILVKFVEAAKPVIAVDPRLQTTAKIIPS